MNILEFLNAASRLGVGSEDPDDREGAEYTRAVAELLATVYMPEVGIVDARNAITLVLVAAAKGVQ